MKNFNILITIISLIACYYSLQYIYNNTEVSTFMFIFVVCACLLYSWTIYFGIREKTFLSLIKFLILLISFPILALCGIINAVYQHFTNKEIMWLFTPIHWILKKLNKSING